MPCDYRGFVTTRELTRRAELPLLVGEHDLHPTVLRTAALRSIFRQRIGFAVTDHLHALFVHPKVFQNIGHFLSTLARQGQIRRLIALIIGITLDTQDARRV